MTKIFKAVTLLIFILISLFVYDFFIVEQKIENKGIVVKKGTSPIKIYNDLGISYNIFDKIYFKITKEDKKIKNGKYEFSENLSKYSFIGKMVNYKENNVVLTIPEGFTTEQVLARIENLKLASKSEMLDEMKKYDFYYKHSSNFEGYLYPETYFIPTSASPKEILDIILGTFIEKYPIDNYDKDKMYDVVTLASIIEKEARVDEDRPKIASVFINRINIGMALQSDATLKYELKRNVTKKDFKESDSKYNTYRHKGLTPTPIGNPGSKSIDAALNPEKDFNYLYFFMYDGKTYYSKTHESHLQKRRESGQLK